MTIRELEQAVEDLILNIYQKRYNKGLQVLEYVSSDGLVTGYLLVLNLNKCERPIVLGIEGSLELFLCFIEKLLRASRFDYNYYYTGYKEYGNEDEDK